MAEGHYVCYVQKNFSGEALATIQAANTIIEEYEGRNMAMSLRQLYYQLVARGLLPNTKINYGKIGDLIRDGRLAGLVSWTAIEDRGRNLRGYQTFGTAQGAVKWLREEHYRIDMWEGQPFRPEVWVEKEALEGVIATICNELRVDFFACKGYNSQSEQWRAGRRFAGYVARGQRPIVFHLGDHDPSGLDMTRDNRERLSLFAGAPVQLVRIALSMDQVERYQPPPNPAKIKDPRFDGYQRQYGNESWELDALRPEVIRGLIEEAVVRVRDPQIWDDNLRREASDKIELEDMVDGDN